MCCAQTAWVLSAPGKQITVTLLRSQTQGYTGGGCTEMLGMRHWTQDSQIPLTCQTGQIPSDRIAIDLQSLIHPGIAAIAIHIEKHTGNAETSPNKADVVQQYE